MANPMNPETPGADVEPEVPVTIEPTQVRPDDEGRIQYEDEVTEDADHTDVANRPSNPNQLPPAEGGKGRKLENPIMPVDE
jgi:hypothetical protein